MKRKRTKNILADLQSEFKNIQVQIISKEPEKKREDKESEKKDKKDKKDKKEKKSKKDKKHKKDKKDKKGIKEQDKIEENPEEAKIVIQKKGFFPALNHYNLTVEILRYLKHSKLMRVVSKLSQGARFTVYSSLVW